MSQTIASDSGQLDVTGRVRCRLLSTTLFPGSEACLSSSKIRRVNQARGAS